METESSEATAAACTLEAGDFQQRLDWIAALNRAALLHTRREGRRLILTYDRAQAKIVREMVERERQCCGFLGFELREDKDRVTLVIEAPEEVADALDTVFAPFLATSPQPGAACCTPCGTE